MQRVFQHRVARFFYIIIYLVLNTSVAPKYDVNAKIKALYMYNFAKYIEWPSSYKTGDFVIGVVGETPVYQNLQAMAKVKKVFNQSIKIVKYSSASEVQKCHMLLLPTAMTSKVSECSSKIKASSTLLVTEKPGVGTRSGINFVVVNQKQKFELNKGNISSHNLTVSGNLLKLAIVI